MVSSTPSTTFEIGYCTNVHAGTDLPAIRNNLSRYAVAVRQKLDTQRLGVGLWIPDQASRELIDGGLAEFREFLQTNQLTAFTINGFPFANFHGESVKQRVYLPTWQSRERLEYTERLATILAGLLDEDQSVGSISTLPIGWPENPFTAASGDRGNREQSGEHFRQLVKSLQQIEQDTGKRIVVAIEPEPGCLLDTVEDIVEFFDAELPEAAHRRYLTVCHDICHSVVMNEPQREVIERYGQAGIGIGKVQVSSAIVADWSEIPEERYADALTQLGEFAEDRYLHQTGQLDASGTFRLANDLPELLRETTPEQLESARQWMIHFHVPIFLESLGYLSTSRNDVLECLEAVRSADAQLEFTGHLEVETYAWTVLPESMRQRGLADDIASELQWLTEQL
ncbi:metabolite traffic protein EboE [Roseiconus nitratireducens]|uniref:metabolite traffic protein EboE n=1 Tax=Roseiconus nitratireducens TaxID=2605748 RepID=UPI001F3B20BC|nr:metabolite traffic protein EboE [Roseiconus nitratireducens]